MGLSADADLDERIHAYDKWQKKYKDAEKQVESLKDWFKDEAGDEDAVFVSSKGVEVRVTHGEQERYDTPKLDAHFGAKACKFKKKTPTKTVTIKRGKTKKVA